MIAATAIAVLVPPLLVLRGRTLAACYGAQFAFLAVAFLATKRLSLDPYLESIATIVLALVLFALFLARGTNVRWSATRAALVAAVLYGLLLPAMLRTPIDGDEPFYLLQTESLVRDGDLDLANQYTALERSEAGRTDLVPQYGDPVGPNGEQYSRHEPLLALLMVPGYWLAGLHGAIATIVLFAVLLVRSTIRWLEEEGIDDATIRAVFPFFAFAPPVVFYAARIWPEVPAALFFVEAVRGMRHRRVKRWLPALFLLVMVKLRFVLVAVGCLVAWLPGSLATRQPGNRGIRKLVLLALLLAAPMLLLWLVTGNPLATHSWRELIPTHPRAYVNGFFGLFVDGQSGMFFRAPFLLLGIYAATRWRETPRGFRVGLLASLIYILYLLPRPEWYGGWAPPLRYIVFVVPALTLGAASVWRHISRGVIALIAVASTALVIHGVAYPWRLFHVANGENNIGEFFSTLYGADFSRLFPSFTRLNDAAWIGSVAIVLLFVIARLKIPSQLQIALVALAISGAFVYAKQPATTIEFEDSHVFARGGRLFPDLYVLHRYAYRGGRILHGGESLTFLAAPGTYTFDYVTGVGAMIELEGRAYHLPPSPSYASARVVVNRGGRVTLRCVSGSVNVDRMVQ